LRSPRTISSTTVSDDPPPPRKRSADSPQSRRRAREGEPIDAGAETLAPPPPSADGDRPTVSPPFDVEAFARATTVLGPAAAGQDSEAALKGDRITLTNEVELEIARVRSAHSSEPPRTRSSGALSFADALAPSTPLPPSRSLSPSSIEAAVLGVMGSSPAPEISERTIDDPLAEMRERFSLGDYTGALEMAELILTEEPANLEAAECGENCRAVLETMLATKIGPLDRVATVIVPRTQMRWLSIDHRAGFILSLIDGSSSIEMILDVSGMPKLDALRILYELLQQRIVALR
jgi:hypothetical protein